MIDILISPTTPWSPERRALTVEKPSPRPPTKVGWEVLAQREQWSEAIIEYLRQHWRQAIPIWRLLNLLVAESLPGSRLETRLNTRAALDAMMNLIRRKRVLLYKRRLVAILDLGEQVVPLETISAERLRKV